METVKPRKKYRALSLDGGGARGLFTSSLLSLIAENETIHNPKRPFYELFNLIVGVSIGAIIGAAIACGIFEDEIKRKNLIRDGKDIFGLQNDCAPFWRPIYTGREKASLLKKNFGTLQLKDCKVHLMIICTTINFYPYIIKSWLPEYRELYLADVLNATSAAPYFFPPAQIDNRLFWDGGLYSNMPTDIAVLWLKKLFNPDKNPNFEFQVLSIGTTVPPTEPQPKEETKIEDPNECGLIVLFQLGIIKAVGGLYNTTCTELMEYEYGDKVILRLTANLDPKFDDVTDEYQLKVRYESERVFTKHKLELEEFFH